MARSTIHISVVSHGQAGLLKPLLLDIQKYVQSVDLRLILTLNVPEDPGFSESAFSYPLQVIRNPKPQGFAANHNQAFRITEARHPTDYFCILNPDIRLSDDPFPPLLEVLGDPTVGVVAPLIRSPEGRIEDSARGFPTPAFIFRKALAKALSRPASMDYPVAADLIYPDWLAGMFMLFRSDVFRKIGGFDEGYFLYYEDVDLCARLHLAGFRAALCPSASAIHGARRASHRDLRHFRWHVTSMLRFF